LPGAYWGDMDRFTERLAGIALTVDHTTVDAARAIRALSDTDLVRLKALAQLWSRGLPGGLGWVDILNEAIVRVLDGSRPWPPRVPLLAFLSGVMRSICLDHWRRARRELVADDLDMLAEDAEEVPDQERTLAAAQALSEVTRLFAHDPPARKIIAGLSEGLTAHEIQRLYGLSETEYDTARKRMRRALLRCGLAGESR
jgi:DNA-directed RNA polymerase specialized sigma24 family protein